jgi:hypothetical protein
MRSPVLLAPVTLRVAVAGSFGSCLSNCGKKRTTTQPIERLARMSHSRKFLVKQFDRFLNPQ